MKKFAVLGGVVVVMLVAAGAACAEDGVWKANAAVGATMTDGNSETLSVTPEVGASLKQDRNEWALKALYAYGENDGDVTEENGKATAQYNRLLNDATFCYANAEAGYDDVANINYRAMVGLGVGQYLLKGDAMNLAVELGATYIFDEKEIAQADGSVDTEADDRVAARLAQKFDTVVSDTTKIWESVEYLPQVDDTDVYLLNLDLGIEVAINGQLSLRVAGQYRYDSDPAPGVEEGDTAVKASLVYNLK